MGVELTADDFTRLQQMVHRLAGISLKAGKEALAVGRMRRRMRELKVDEVRDYLKLVERDDTGNEATLLIDALSTNVTSFFRESSHFGLFEGWLRTLRAGGARRARVWCAAAATGEEPWTLAMYLRQVFNEPQHDVALLATDISTRALATARQGVYAAESVAKLPTELRQRWFTRADDGLVVHDELRPLITFNRMNLVRPPYPMRGGFDVVFCRNVMIYFDNPTRQVVVNEIQRLLKPGGYLCLGHAESLAGLVTTLQPVAPAAYRNPPA